MAITKQTIVEKIEVVGGWNIQIAQDTVITEGNSEIGRSRHRQVLIPFVSVKDGDTWTHTDTDISGQDSTVQAIATAAWTDTVKANYKTWKEALEV